MTKKYKNTQKRLDETLDFLRRYTAENKIAPSLLDIVCEGLASSTSHAGYILNLLEADGKIKKLPRAHRGIVLLEDK